jgi:hypothetical protein
MNAGQSRHVGERPLEIETEIKKRPRLSRLSTKVGKLSQPEKQKLEKRNAPVGPVNAGPSRSAAIKNRTDTGQAGIRHDPEKS